jgi:tetratricopeptide (TPR) repeat protein
MKLVPTFLTALLGLFFVAPEADARGAARGGGGGGGGRAKASAPKRSGGGSTTRSPMTGSKVQRPQSRPAPKPAARPAAKPAAKPATRPVQKPSVQKPAGRPDTGTAKLPDRRPDSGLPDKRPAVERPGGNKPSTLPGMVSYPNKPDKGKMPTRPGTGGNERPGLADRPGNNDRPGIGNRPGDNDRPGIGNRPGDNNRPDRKGPSIVDRGDRVNIGGDRTKIGGGDRNRVHIDNVNVGRKNVGLNRPATLPANRRDWDGNRWGGNNSVWGNKVNIGNDINVNINNRFRNNNNFAMRPNYWGARPWWGCNNYHNWHHGHWGYGWNSAYYRNHWWYDDDDDFAEGFMWGIGVWSLGNMIYNMGYQSYRNPYPAPKVENTYITYTQPVSVAAAANPPGDEEAAATAEAKSAEALEASRAAFKSGDYVTALSKADEAIGYVPGDVTMHEYRALCYFALGKFGEAAGVLNPVLASGPGWSWDTMIGFYDGSSAYNDQLKKLEDYAKSSGKAHGHFLLGYHYMVCGHLEKSNEQFAKASEMEPGDSISRQLAALTKDSIPGDEGDAEPPARPAPVPADKLVGTWTAAASGGKVTFTLTAGGDYTWGFQPTGGEATTMKGTYGLDDKGLLILTSDDTQMVSAIEMKAEGKLHFMLVGAPDNDPGLDFTKG